MNFFRLRVINTFLLFAIGILFGFIIKDRLFKSENADLSASSRARQTDQNLEDADLSPFKDSNADSSENKEYNVFDDDIEYTPHQTESQNPESSSELENEEAPRKFINLSVPFFKNPERFKNEIVNMDVQMIFAKKTASGWLFNLMHIDSKKNISYVYINGDSDLIKKRDFKIGYFYRVSFKCSKGKLNKGNSLVSIDSTEKKADWATGVSAIE